MDYEGTGLETIKMARLRLCAAAWLQAKVHDHGLELQPMLPTSLSVTHSTAEAACGTIQVYLTFTLRNYTATSL